MTQSVIHQPRVAWDGARAFVRAATGPRYDAFAGQVISRLGAELYTHLADSRERILTAAASGGDRHTTDTELGKWRVRLDDLLRTRPELTEVIRDLTAFVH
ncbi:MAG: hypothetical protein QOE51_2039 [Actinoplanes sp.]|jgi:hypothetical protein|nr:hypothetical protein [Actinoplanes sp.]